MPTIQDLEFADLRVVRDDDGKITSIIDTTGRDVGLVSAKVDSVTGRIGNLSASGRNAVTDLGLGDPAFTPLMATLKEGVYSPVITVLGDSTGYPDYQWVRKLADRFAADFPSLRIQYERFNDSTQDYDATVVVQAGGGERSIRFTGVRGRFQSAGDVGDWTNDLDVSAKLSLDSWSTASQQSIVSRYGLYTNGYSFNLYQYFGTLRFDFVDTSQTGHSCTSTASIPFSSGQVGWVRATYVKSTGVVTFYTGTDGVAWTQLGTAISSGVTSGIAVPTTKDYEIGSCNGALSSGAGASQQATGNFYVVRIRDGVNGPILNAQPIESWCMANADGTSLAGGQTLYINNGSISGATLAYLSNAARLKMLSRNSQPSLTFLSCSHNDTAAMSKAQLNDPWDAFLTALKARSPESNFCLVTQNPKISPALFIEPHGQRAKRLMVWARRSGISVIDTYSSFVSDGRGIAALTEPSDGVHPNPDGGTLWCNVVYARFSGQKL